MSLREITKDLHTEAERTIFAKKLIGGTLTKEEYANYLWQMVLVYNGIETAANSQGMFATLPDIARTHKIYQDCIELVGPNHQLKWLPSVIDYYQYLLELNCNPEKRHRSCWHARQKHSFVLLVPIGELATQICSGTRRDSNAKWWAANEIDELQRLNPKLIA
jgi:hypothetical protein